MAELISQQQRAGRVLRWFGITLILLAVLMGLTAGGAVWVLHKLEPVLSAEALPMPETQLSPFGFQVLRGRLEAFRRAQAEGNAAELRLTGREINALFALHDDWAWGRGVAATRIEGGRLYVFISLPVSRMPVVGLFGSRRYANLILETAPRFENGRLEAGLVRAWLGSRRPADEAELENIRGMLARGIRQPFPFTEKIVRGALLNLSDCQAEGDTLVVRCGGFGRAGKPGASAPAQPGGDLPAVRAALDGESAGEGPVDEP